VLVTNVLALLPCSPHGAGWEPFFAWLWEHQIDRLGWEGTFRLLRLHGDLGLPDLSPSDQREYAVHLASSAVKAGCLVDTTLSSEVVCVAVYRISYRGDGHRLFVGEVVRGVGTSFAQLCDGVQRRRFLRAARLPLSQWVDRSRCSEFQALEELCRRISVASMRVPRQRPGQILDIDGGQGDSLSDGLVGIVELFVFGAPPCLSCLAAMQQFRGMFPSIELRIRLERMLCSSAPSI